MNIRIWESALLINVWENRRGNHE